MPRRLLVVCLAAALLVSSAAARKRKDDPVFQSIDSVVQSLSRISGFSEQHPVRYGSMSKPELSKFLRKRMKKTLKPDEIRVNELALKMFGLVPADFDLKKSTIDLLTEQAAAFYDYDERKLFLLEGAPVADETTTLAHELSHALADQHFDLEKFMDQAPASDDENLAHSAVVEGQASWLMLAYNLAESGRKPEPTEEALKQVEESGEDLSGEFPVLKSSPLYIQQSLLFPYADGIRFFDAAYRHWGKESFARVFSQPPNSSSQIYHPERYFKGEKVTAPNLPELTLPSGSHQLTDGSVGEFDHRLLIWQYLGAQKGRELSSHLGAAQFALWQQGKKGAAVLNYVSQWDSPPAARNYFAAYKKVIVAKSLSCDPVENTRHSFAGKSERGFFIVTTSGVMVSSVEGLSNPEEWQRLRKAGTAADVESAYSSRRAVNGSTAAARRAGMKLAATATATRMPIAKAKVAGSNGFRP